MHACRLHFKFSVNKKSKQQVKEMEGGQRKLWFTSATWIWWSVLIMGAAAAAGEDGNARPAPLLIKPVVGFTNNVGHGPSTNAEPRVRMFGRNGLCAEVRDGAYVNENGVRLWTCRSDSDARQLWTFMEDGTIRSLNWCLTASGNRTGDYCMIRDCNIALQDATIWRKLDDGTIVNPRYGLAMTGEGHGAFLTVEINIYSPGQGWQVGNVATLTLASIVVFNDLCMEADGSRLSVENCSSFDQEQTWALYPDGSIRPKGNRNHCLTCPKDVAETVITIDTCSSGISGQRWVFTKVGSILNPGNGLVMDVRASDPSLREIIIFPYHGKPNQKWSIRL